MGESRGGEEAQEEDKNGAKFFDRFEDRKKGVGRKQSAFPDTYTHYMG